MASDKRERDSSDEEISGSTKSAKIDNDVYVVILSTFCMGHFAYNDAGHLKKTEQIGEQEVLTP